ncbi:MAG: ribosomal protein L13e [Candidatus Bathyarchaeota archaeon]|nr:MAG: ribosomal protein L13e [Candidatus Bathyarchaeota archaeon]
MSLQIRSIVHKKRNDKRKGRGFSREELKKAGLSPKQALRIGIPIDSRRRTIHPKNVKLVKQQLSRHSTKIRKGAN